MQTFLNRGLAPRPAGPQQLLQDRLDAGLTLPRRQVQDAQVFPGRPLRLLLDQPVVDQAEATRRKQVVPIAVVGEGPRFAHQPVDDVPVVDALLAPTAQARQAFDEALAIPHLDVVGVQACLDPFADQAARHRVRVVADVDGTARIHSHFNALGCVHPLGRQRPQHSQLLGEPRPPALVPLGEQLPQERFVGRPAGEVAAAAQHQGLVQHRLNWRWLCSTSPFSCDFVGLMAWPCKP